MVVDGLGLLEGIALRDGGVTHAGHHRTMTEFQRRVVEVIRGLRPGEVVSYGDVAVEAGYARGAGRGVGNVLQQVDELPWWRVVTATGRLVPGLESEQARRLGAEGVPVKAGRVPSMGCPPKVTARGR